MIRNRAGLAGLGWPWALIAVSLAAGAGAQSPIQRGQGLPSLSASQRKDNAEGSENTIKFRITRRPRQEEAAPPAPGAAGSTFALDPGDAEWTLSISDSAEVLIFHRGVQVAKGTHAFWAQGESSAGAHLSVTARTSNLVLISGAVDGLGLKVQGSAQPVSPRELRVDLEIGAAKAFSGISGGGMSWTFNLDSPSFGGKVGEPKLLLDKTGWRWPVAVGQELMVRFDEPLARLFFDHDKQNEVRTHFVGDRHPTGPRADQPDGDPAGRGPDQRDRRGEVLQARRHVGFAMRCGGMLRRWTCRSSTPTTGLPAVTASSRQTETGLSSRTEVPRDSGCQPGRPRAFRDAKGEHPPSGAADRPAWIQHHTNRTARIELGPTQHLRQQCPGYPAPRPAVSRCDRLLDQVSQGRGGLRLARHALSAGDQAGRRRDAGLGRDRTGQGHHLGLQLHQPAIDQADEGVPASVLEPRQPIHGSRLQGRSRGSSES